MSVECVMVDGDDWKVYSLKSKDISLVDPRTPQTSLVDLDLKNSLGEPFNECTFMD